MAKNLQLYRNDISSNLFSSKELAIENLKVQLETSSDGEIVLARYDNNGVIETIFGIAASGDTKSGYTIFESAKEITLGNEENTKNFLENEGTDGEQVLAVREITTDVTKTSADIIVAGLTNTLGAGGYVNGTTIPAGTSIEEILIKLLSKELYPNAATKPSIDIDGEKSFGLMEVYSTVTIPAVTMKTNVGKFNASYTSPTQPSVDGVSFTNQTMKATTTGFKSVEIASGTTSVLSVSTEVEIGTNKIVYEASSSYSAPSNMPLTNLGKSTSKTGETASDGTAIWASGTSTKTVETTAIGVYPCYSNISGEALTENADTKLNLQSGSTFEFANVPSEVANNQVFMFDFPSTHKVTSFKTLDPSNDLVDFAAEYTTSTEVDKVINGQTVKYNRLMTSEASQGIVKMYKITLDKTLNQN